MANKLPCGKCDLYYPVQRPTPKGGFKSLGHGHCLDRTIYAKNKPGHPVYPPRAKVEDRPYGQHQVAVVQENETVPGCTAAKARVA